MVERLLISPSEAAKALGISPKTLLAHVRAGHIRYVRIGTGKKKQRRKFTRSDLEEFIESSLRHQFFRGFQRYRA
jgi:excisionase family DNA binding protein